MVHLDVNGKVLLMFIECVFTKELTDAYANRLELLIALSVNLLLSFPERVISSVYLDVPGR